MSAKTFLTNAFTFKLSEGDLLPVNQAGGKLSPSRKTAKKGLNMKGKRHSEEQIIGVLKEAQAGVAVKEICRLHGISEQTYYKWKRKFGGMETTRFI